MAEPGDHMIGGLNDGSKPGRPLVAARAALVIRIAVEDRIVEIEDEALRAAA